MNRQFEIVRSQFNQLSWTEFGALLGKNLYANEPLLVYRRSLGLQPLTPVEPGPGIRIEKGDLAELECLVERLSPLPWEFQCHRYDGVEDCFVAKDDEGIQHISWIYRHNHRNRLLRLSEQEAEVKFCLTLPRLRGRGIYPKVIETIAGYLQEQNVRRLYMCVHRDNLASIRGIEKAGLTRAGALRLRKLLGIQISRRLTTGGME